MSSRWPWFKRPISYLSPETIALANAGETNLLTEGFVEEMAQRLRAADAGERIALRPTEEWASNAGMAAILAFQMEPGRWPWHRVRRAMLRWALQRYFEFVNSATEEDAP